MTRAAGGMLILLAFTLPFVIVPWLSDRVTDAVAMSYGMQGPAISIGTPLLVMMIQGLRLWNNE